MGDHETGAIVDVSIHGGEWQTASVIEIGASGGMLKVRVNDAVDVWLAASHVRAGTRREGSPATAAARGAGEGLFSFKSPAAAEPASAPSAENKSP